MNTHDDKEHIKRTQTLAILALAITRCVRFFFAMLSHYMYTSRVHMEANADRMRTHAMAIANNKMKKKNEKYKTECVCV